MLEPTQIELWNNVYNSAEPTKADYSIPRIFYSTDTGLTYCRSSDGQSAKPTLAAYLHVRTKRLARTEKRKASRASRLNGITQDTNLGVTSVPGTLTFMGKGNRRELRAWLFDRFFQHIPPGFDTYPDTVEIQKSAWTAYQDGGDAKRLSLPKISRPLLDAYITALVK